MPEVLRDHTSFHIGGPARAWVEATTEEQVLSTVRACDAAGEPLLVLSGGSNLLISDEGFAGTVLKIATRGIAAEGSFCEFDADAAGPDPLAGSAAACGGYTVKVAAGESWDAFVAYAVANELVGIEALSGIPGLVGSTPIQNVGAYGQEVSQTIWSVRTYDRQAAVVRTFANADCGFSYRRSRFKAEPGRYVVLDVTFQLQQGSLSAPIRYGELARRLGVEGGRRAPLGQVRETVLGLRRSKGMVIDPADHDTWSAGSFFTNPLLDPGAADALPAEAPRFPQPDGTVKSSAAWLIEHAGFHKGFGNDRVGLSTKHTLALTNRGEGSADDVVALARVVRDGVRERFGVTLVPEPVLVGVRLD